MGGIELKFSNTLDVRYYCKKDGSPIEDTPEERFNLLKWHAMNALFKQFEDVERKNLHDIESEKLLLEIMGDIAKAKVEKKDQICLEGVIHPSDINFELSGKDKEWQARVVTKANIAELILARSNSDYYHGFASIETILRERRVGIFYLAVSKLLKRRKNIKILIGRKLAGSRWEPTLMISW